MANATLEGDTTLCPGDSSTFHLSTSSVEADWYLDGIFITTDTIVSVSASLLSPVQVLKAIVSNACFTDTIIQSIYSINSPVLSLNEDTVIICGTDQIPVYAIPSLDTLLWTTSQTTVLDTQLIISSSYPHETYIFAQGQNAYNCPSNIDSALVLISNPITINISVSPTICSDDFVTIQANASAVSLNWSGPYGNVSGGGFTFPLATNEGMYIVTAEDDLGCEWMDTVEIYATGANTLIFPDTILCFTEWLQIQIASNTYDYTTITSLPIDPSTINNYSWYSITATNEFGCSITDSVYILKVVCSTNIPNVITPNGDGVNDYFLIDFALKHPNNKLIILNRWGNVVFQADGYKNNWDGGNLHDGVYTYLYYSDGKTQSTPVEQGFLHLIR